MADEFELWELIAAPIKAMNEAEAEGASRFVELFLDYALEQPEETPATARAAPAPATDARLREVAFEISRPGMDGESVPHRLSVPLMQMLPFGGVCIDQATLTYGLALSTGPAGAAGGRFRGRLAQNQGAAGSDSNFNVEVKLRQMDMPQGLVDLLNHTQGVAQSPVTSPPVPPAEPGSSPASDPTLPSPGPAAPVPPVSAIDPNLFRARVLELQQQAATARAILEVIPREDLKGALHLSFASVPENMFKIEVRQEVVSGAGRVMIGLLSLGREATQLLTDGRLGLLVSGAAVDGVRGVHNSLVAPLPASKRGKEPTS